MKLKEVMTLSKLNNKEGFFSSSYNTLNFLTEDEALQLDFNYYLQHSANKNISSLYSNMLNNLSDLYNMIKFKFKSKWERIYNTFTNTTYNPLHDHSEQSIETPNLTDTENLSTSKSKDEKTNVNISETNNSDINSGIYGFNSSSSVNSEDQSSNNSSLTTGSKDDNYTITTETESGQNTKSKTGTIRKEIEGRKSSAATLITEELELRKQNIYNIIMNDLDSLLCNQVY